MFVENINTISLYEFFNQKFKNTISLRDKNILFYTNSSEEYNSLRQGIGIHINYSSLIIELIGKDVLDFLHRVSSNVINDVKPYYKRNTLFLNEKGRFIDRATYINFGDYHLLIGNKDSNNKLFSWINRYIIAEDIKTRDISDNYLLLDFIGPQTESFLTLLIGNELKSLNGENVLKCIVDGFEFFVFSHHEPFGNKYYKVLISSIYSTKFLEHLEENRSAFDLSFVGDSAFQKYRIESGIPAFPNEINDENNPHEVSLLDEVNFKKGCYIGQEVIARLETYDKVQNRIIKVELNSAAAVTTPSVIINDLNEEIGEITSVYNCGEEDKYIGLAIVKQKFLNGNTKLNLKIGSSAIPINYQEFQKAR